MTNMSSKSLDLRSCNQCIFEITAGKIIKIVLRSISVDQPTTGGKNTNENALIVIFINRSLCLNSIVAELSMQTVF